MVNIFSLWSVQLFLNACFSWQCEFYILEKIKMFPFFTLFCYCASSSTWSSHLSHVASSTLLFISYKFFVFRRIKLKFCSWLYKKRWHTLWKFQLEITCNKKVIAKKPLTNLYEMNSTFSCGIRYTSPPK